MNNDQAKFILHAYRPDGADASDATFEAALAQARQDPALGAWLERLQAFDRAMAQKLGQVVPPAGLREAILTGGQVSTPTRRTVWWQPVWLAAAAAIAITAVTVLSLRPARVEAATLAAFAAGDAVQRHPPGEGEVWSDFQGVLAAPTTRFGGALPVDFEALRTKGCRTIDFQGREVLEICFKRDGNWFHCYIARRVDFPGATALAAPAIVAQGAVHLATWADDTHLFAVVSKAGREALERMI